MKMLKEKRTTIELILIHIAYCMALLLILVPIMMVAKYNFPSADDWTFGKHVYHAIQDKKGIGGFFVAIWKTVKGQYLSWEGRYSIVMIGALQPGVWGEQYYVLVPYMMIGSLILGQMYFAKTLLSLLGKENKKYIVPLVFPAVMMQVLFCPSAVESFFWYNGSASYTLVYAMELLLFSLVLKLCFEPLKKGKRVCVHVCAVVLAIIIGGDNYAGSLSTVLALTLMEIYLFWKNKKGFRSTLHLPIIMLACMIWCMKGPGVVKRIDGNFGGSTAQSAPIAVINSLVRSATNMYSWTNIKVIFVLLLLLPFIWEVVRKTNVVFRVPGVFSLLSFGVYASQCTATMYVEGTTGGGRMAAVLYDSYLLWMVVNLFYWVGYFYGKREKLPPKTRKVLRGVAQSICKYALIWCAVIGGVLVVWIYCFDLKTTVSYRVYRDWRQGWAKQYAEEWQARFEVLHDESVAIVEFEPLSIWPETYMYTDLQPEKGYKWVNNACASYYRKEKVKIVETEK